MSNKTVRMFIDCREFPDATGCTMVLQANDRQELIHSAMHHSIHVHGAKDSPEFRRLLDQSIRDGHPPEKAPAPQYMTLLAMQAAHQNTNS